MRESNENKDFQATEEILDRSAYPLFTVVVLCYKNRHYLNRMLESVFSQEYPNIELVVSDDGSADFSVSEVCSYIERKRGENITQFRVLKNNENIGTVRHIAGVLQNVNGKYMVFTAADDRFANDEVFSAYVDAFEQQKDKLWIVGKCNILTADFKRSIYVTPTRDDVAFFYLDDPVKLYSRWSRRGMAIPCCMAFRVEAFDAVGGIDLDYTYLEDWPLVLKLLRNGHAPIFLNEITALHSAGGVTNSNDAYGVEVRKKFYDDKDLVYTKEVEPYLDLLTPEDQQILTIYRKEICERNYFLDITWNQISRKQKIGMLLQKDSFVWLLEKYFEQFEKYLRKPKMLLIAHLLCLCSAFLLNNASVGFLTPVFRTLGYADFAVAVLVILAAFAAIPIGRHVRKVRELRRSLVN